MKISIVEDMKYSISKIWIDLKKEWFCISDFSSFSDFKKNYLYDSDLYIIDASSSFIECLNIIKWLKNKKSDSPIIVIFWSIVLENIVELFNIWIDDYLLKWYFKEELYARIRSLIRKKHKVTNTLLTINDSIIYDTTNRIFIKNDCVLKLTAREVRLAEYFIFNIWNVVTKIQLINSVWWEYDILSVTDNNINVILSNVRRKLWKWYRLKTIVNVWYVLEGWKG